MGKLRQAWTVVGHLSAAHWLMGALAAGGASILALLQSAPWPAVLIWALLGLPAGLVFWELVEDKVRLAQRGSDDLQEADFERSDQREDFMVYEAAFLWHGLEPPGMREHEDLMPTEVAATKRLLHQAIEAGLLTTALNKEWHHVATDYQGREMLVGKSFRRHVTPAALLAFCDRAQVPIPEFVLRHPRRLSQNG